MLIELSSTIAGGKKVAPVGHGNQVPGTGVSDRLTNPSQSNCGVVEVGFFC
jgi:hypothetical protein